MLCLLAATNIRFNLRILVFGFDLFAFGIHLHGIYVTTMIQTNVMILKNDSCLLQLNIVKYGNS